jgi:hypothetical protein
MLPSIRSLFMSPEEARKTVEIIGRWLELRVQGGYEPITGGRDFQVEAEHSLRGGLLARLLVEGKEPLEHTPPLAFSRPWYSLIETGETVVEKEFVSPAVADSLAICQHQWHIVKRDGDAYEVAWRPDEDGKSHWGLWKVTPTTDAWLITRVE